MKLFLIVLLTVNYIIPSAAQWQRVEQLPAQETSCIYEYDDTLYTAVVNRLYISSNGGIDWKETSVVRDQVDFISCMQKWNDRLFIGTYNYGVFISENMGETWRSFNTGFTGLGSNFILDLEIRGDSIYAATGGGGIFLLNLQNGTSWVPFNNGLSPSTSYTVYTLFNLNGTLYAGAGGNPLVFSNKYGTDVWSETQFDIFRAEPNSIMNFFYNEEMLFAAANYGIYSSDDSGKTWDRFDPMIGYIGAASFGFNNGILYAFVGKPGITFFFSSYDNGQTWNLFDQSSTLTYNFIIYNDKIFASQYGGLFVCPLTPTYADDKFNKIDFYLFQNYPNPFNPSTIISFGIKEEGNVSLKIYDVLGNEAAVLINKVMQAGIHTVEFNSNEFNLPSGIYYYRLESSSFKETKKMILLK